MECLLVPRTAEYALRAAAVLAAHPGPDPLPTREVGRASGVPEAYLSKVLRLLEQGGVVRASRGRRGGYRLARPASEIRFLDVLEAVEFGCEGVHCAFGWNRCNAATPCPLHHSFASLRSAFLAWASGHVLSDVDASRVVLGGGDGTPVARRRGPSSEDPMNAALRPLALATALVAGCASPTPDGDATAWDVVSVGGLYDVHVTADEVPAMGSNVFHVDLTTAADGDPVADATVTLEATMPAHGHGLDPLVCSHVGGGRYDATLTLPMAGAWRLDLDLDAAGGADAAVVDLEVR